MKSYQVDLTEEEICGHISGSGFFFMNSRHPYSPFNKQNHPKKSLMVQHPIIFSHLFKVTKEEKQKIMPRYHHEMKGPKERDVYVGAYPQKERVFRCVDLLQKTIDEFYFRIANIMSVEMRRITSQVDSFFGTIPKTRELKFQRWRRSQQK